MNVICRRSLIWTVRPDPDVRTPHRLSLLLLLSPVMARLRSSNRRCLVRCDIVELRRGRIDDKSPPPPPLLPALVWWLYVAVRSRIGVLSNFRPPTPTVVAADDCCCWLLSESLLSDGRSKLLWAFSER